MIDLTFRTAKGPMVLQLCAPTATPEGHDPWAVKVITNGRVQTLPGVTPLSALETAVQFAAGYLNLMEGLDPPVAALRPSAKKQRKRHGRRRKRDDG